MFTRIGFYSMRYWLVRGLFVPVISGIFIAILIAGCKRSDGKHATIDPEDIVIRVGDSILTETEIIAKIPVGLSSEDSLTFHKTIVHDWLDRMLLSEIAADNVEDIEQIERMTREYRNRLLINSYRRKMRESGVGEIPAADIKKYYEQYSQELILERPVVKGLFVKVPSNAPKINDIRRWIFTATPTAIDNLEQYGLVDAVKYSFFEDKWFDFRTITEQIPYRFADMDTFVESTTNFETSYAGITYFLHISEYIKSGEVMPFEIASPIIASTLEVKTGDAYEAKLMQSLYEEALKSGRLKIENDNYRKYFQK